MRDNPDYAATLQKWLTSTPADALVVTLTRAYQEILGANSRRIGFPGPGGEPSLKSLLDARMEAISSEGEFYLSHGARLLQAYFGPKSRPGLPRELRMRVRSLCVFLTLLEGAGRSVFASDAEQRHATHEEKPRPWWKNKPT